jgi:ATP-dependent RNA helicase DDX42
MSGAAGKVSLSLKKVAPSSGLGALLSRGIVRPKADLDAPAPALLPKSGDVQATSRSTEAERTSEPVATADDPLELFMASMNDTLARTAPESRSKAHAVETTEAGDGYDERNTAGEEGQDDDDNEPVYDSDGQRAGTRARKDEFGADGDDVLLPMIDHTSANYEKFEKEFYVACPALSSLTPREIESRQQALDITLEGPSSTLQPQFCPVQSFMQLGIDAAYPALIAAIAKAGYEAPTAIQAQSLPILLGGRDVLGIAQTGSGKTFAYTLPLLRHCIQQRHISPGEGPIGLILAPTRELASQIHVEVRRFARVLGMQAVLLSGGSSKWEQTKALKAGTEIVVATPGRLLDHLRDHSTNLRRVTFLILDEADRMFDLGFSRQLYAIVGNCRPDRQTVLFSATFPRRVEMLAKASLSSPVKIVVGRIGQAAADVTQYVHVVSIPEKFGWISRNLPGFVARGKVIIFANTKASVDDVHRAVSLLPTTTPSLSMYLQSQFAVAIHGEKTQHLRDAGLQAFRSGTSPVLVATDVAARGLDIKGVSVVVNYDVPKSIDTYVHRIGRTGRFEGESFLAGESHTLLTEKESSFASQLVRHLQMHGSLVPDQLLNVARRNPRFQPWSASEGHSTSAAPKLSGHAYRAVNQGLGFEHAGHTRQPKDAALDAFLAEIDTTTPAAGRQVTVALPTYTHVMAEQPTSMPDYLHATNTAPAPCSVAEFEVSVAGDDDAEVEALRRSRSSRFGSSNPSGVSARDDALKDLQGRVQQRMKNSFYSTFQSAGVSGAPQSNVAVIIESTVAGRKRNRWDALTPDVGQAAGGSIEVGGAGAPRKSRWDTHSAPEAAPPLPQQLPQIPQVQRPSWYVPGMRY